MFLAFLVSEKATTKVFLTGATGVLGRRLVWLLCKGGHHGVALRLSASENLFKGSLEKCPKKTLTNTEIGKPAG